MISYRVVNLSMEKIRRMEAIPEQLRYAEVPKSLLKRFIIGRSIRCALCIALAGLMLMPLTVLPGLILFVLPGEVGLVSKIRDETELIQWVRCNMTSGECDWDDVESETELARIRAHDRPNTLQGFAR
jgi:hypothetical protein